MVEEPMEQAKALAKEGNYKEALAIYRQLGGAEAAFGEGACWYKLNNIEKARELLESALGFDPRHPRARALLDKINKEHPQKKVKHGGCMSVLVFGGLLVLSAGWWAAS